MSWHVMKVNVHHKKTPIVVLLHTMHRYTQRSECNTCTAGLRGHMVIFCCGHNVSIEITTSIIVITL